jgi:predicted DNA-binding transcriptional regulator AlpA
MLLSQLIPSDAPPFVNAATIAQWLRISIWTVRRWVAEGRFPPPVHLGPHMHRWSTVQVRAWLVEKEKRLFPEVASHA